MNDELRPVEVSAYAGGRGEEEPRTLRLDGEVQQVTAVEACWREPDGRWFRVRTDRGAELVLLCREADLTWWLRAGS